RLHLYRLVREFERRVCGGQRCAGRHPRCDAHDAGACRPQRPHPRGLHPPPAAGRPCPTEVRDTLRLSLLRRYFDSARARRRRAIDVAAGTWIAWRSRAQVLDGTVRPVIQAGLKRHKEMPEVPLMQELIADRKQAEVAEFLSSGSPIGRALLVPRTVPADRVAALRKAFMEMTADPKFVHDTMQSGLEFDPVPGEELDRITARILETPNDVVALARSVGK